MIFDYPRINFTGTINLNPATANNDDDAAPGPSQLTMPSTFPPYQGQPFGLIDSRLVKVRTFGMTDDDFLKWVQAPQTLDGGTKPIMPSEWNYYGNLASLATAKIVGVQTAAAQAPMQSPLIGASLTFSGGICDVNSEGSPPATQFFIDSMQLTSGSTVFVSGAPTKGACQWINFYRNVNLIDDGGAGGYIYHVLQSGPETTIAIPGFPAGAAGLILRYYIYAPLANTMDPALLKTLYLNQGTNPITAQIVGTIAPLGTDEPIITGPVGRLMVWNEVPQVPTPAGSANNSQGKIMLAPAVLAVNGNTISADFVGTFPENGTTGGKYSALGNVTLQVTAGGGNPVIIGPVAYTGVDPANPDPVNADAGNAIGWLFDFDISSNPAAQTALKDPQTAVFSLVSDALGTLLAETDYYIVTNQQAIYAEQLGLGMLTHEYRNQGTSEPATISVYHRGAPSSVLVTVWSYQATPIQSPGTLVQLAEIQPGEPIVADLSQPGNVLFTFTVSDSTNPPPPLPQSYQDFSFPPWITNAPSISLRILPNDQDFSKYYKDPLSPEPVGNASLTFDVLYTNVLQTYYLLFPAMSMVFALNDEASVRQNAAAILDRTDLLANPSLWLTTKYMPRTRDLSHSRMRLLRAFCRAQLQSGT